MNLIRSAVIATTFAFATASHASIFQQPDATASVVDPMQVFFFAMFSPENVAKLALEKGILIPENHMRDSMGNTFTVFTKQNTDYRTLVEYANDVSVAFRRDLDSVKADCEAAPPQKCSPSVVELINAAMQ